MAEAQKGSIVKPLAGRDKGRYMIVLEKREDGYLVLADGKRRTLEKPKLKNPKHLAVLKARETELPATDKQLRKLLGTFGKTDTPAEHAKEE